ncbi:acyl-CoA dehydrogenase family protein [Actinomadura rugatobispora]|uniref:Acyl-CoA dehydrogenase family protein n=1 Tax=Actinomadura rugatobispora TaxID=1994 RepID=A0ABW0ZSG6_9ACTN|nr:acyl-CoA dehydrogenase family protein [Actinomadura rugatobispora]
MKRDLYDDEHEAFRSTVRRFYADLTLEQDEWRSAGVPPRSFWLDAGKLGLLGIQIPEEYGGGGIDSFLFNAILTEEAQRAGLALGGLRVHTDICMPYYLHLATDDQKARWLPRLASGEAVAALAMTEPGAGSDLRGITTGARRVGDGFVLNGAKTFISNGGNADLIIVAARTGDAGDRGRLSLLVVERGMKGFESGKQLHKIGLKGQDLAELVFDDVEVPVENLLGEEGQGFSYLTRNLAQERLSIGINSQAAAAAAVEATVEYVNTRGVFGTTLSAFQNTKFELAACATEVEAGQALVDRALVANETGDLDPADAAKVKLFTTELQGRVLDRCLQLFGGYGFMEEYPIARAYVDARAARLYAGSSEIMKVIIAKSMGLR